jgi:hypothetical protein
MQDACKKYQLCNILKLCGIWIELDAPLNFLTISAEFTDEYCHRPVLGCDEETETPFGINSVHQEIVRKPKLPDPPEKCRARMTKMPKI